MNRVDLVLIHTGNRFYSYINDCISLINRHDIRLHVILSNSLHSYITPKNIILESAEKYEDEKYRSYKNPQLNPLFRDGFFNRTASRFFILANYAKQKKLKSFFHIENDIALFSNLISEQKILYTTGSNIAIVMDSPNRGVASIMWMKDHKIVEEFADYIYNHNSYTDMQNLAYFFKARSDVVNLPIIHNDKYNNEIQYNNLFHKFNSVFDGAALGQYLFGIDPMNCNNQDTKGFINETNIFNSSIYNFTWKNKQPYIDGVKIANLHMHCKNLQQLL